MAAAAREYFTVDLRGLRAALAARAARDEVTESEVLRSALATALDTGRAGASGSTNVVAGGSPRDSHVKISVRLARPAALRLDQDARAAGLSRGAYLARALQGAAPVVPSGERIALCAALNNSSAELAIISGAIYHMVGLLSRGSIEAARQYTARFQTLERDVQGHMAIAAKVLAELAATR